jgi:lysophospholipase L1-like esterase
MKAKSLFRILFQVVLVLTLLEIGLRVILYQRTSRDPLAITTVLSNIKKRFHRVRPTYLYNGYYLARPDSAKEVNEGIAYESHESNRFLYKPWIDYQSADFSGKYINVKGLVRASVPDICINPGRADTITIFFLGGSTMYGQNATDRETIPAAFVNAYRMRYPNGKSIKVVNYGTCGMHSYGELMLLSHLIYSGIKPSLLVVMDGLNDLVLVNATINRLPFYYYHLKAAGSDDIDFKALDQGNDSTWALAEAPTGMSPDSVRTCVLERYMSNQQNIRDLAVRSGIKPFFFIQPVPFYHYPNRKNDPICEQTRSDLFEKGYATLQKKADSAGSYTFLGDLLEKRQGYPFIDRFHYSPAMSATIADSILDVVGRAVNGY